MTDSGETREADSSADSRAATASVEGVDAGFGVGRVLGGRYEVRGLLGRGGSDTSAALFAALLDAGGSLEDIGKIDQSAYRHLDTFDELARLNASLVFRAMEFE
mgnify:CR=1 FL=1